MNLQSILSLEPGDRCVVVFRGAPLGMHQSDGLRINTVKGIFRSFHLDEKTPANSVLVMQMGAGETCDIAFPIADVYVGKVSNISAVASIVKPFGK